VIEPMPSKGEGQDSIPSTKKEKEEGKEGQQGEGEEEGEERREEGEEEIKDHLNSSMCIQEIESNAEHDGFIFNPTYLGGRDWEDHNSSLD
jgi:hypothetical protein